MFAKSSANVTTSEVKPSLYGEAGHTLIAYMVVWEWPNRSFANGVSPEVKN